MTEDGRYVCWRCRVSYRLAMPAGNAERLRCPEAGCAMAFWAAKERGVIKIGVYPDELAGAA